MKSINVKHLKVVNTIELFCHNKKCGVVSIDYDAKIINIFMKAYMKYLKCNECNSSLKLHYPPDWRPE